MNVSLRRALVFALFLAGSAQAACAADSTLTLVVAGEAAGEPPRFAVSFAGETVGEGTVAAALDATTGRLANLSDRSAYVQSFTFRLPTARFVADGDVAVRLLNAGTAAPGGPGRALYVSAILVNGRAVTASGVRVVRDGAVIAAPLLGEFVALTAADVSAEARAPVGGWPAPPESDPVTTGAIAPAVPVAQAAKTEVERRGCDLKAIYNVVGFNANSNAVTPQIAARLDQVVADIGARRCRVRLTGYSSMTGAIDANALFAVERAQNALAYLRTKGVAFEVSEAVGGGATTRFGEAPRANRRVVIAVSP